MTKTTIDLPFSPDDVREGRVVGHKTFHSPERGYYHEPLYEGEAAKIMAACDKAQAERAERMPDEKAALLAMVAAHTRLGELGWRNAMYCPKDGSSFQVIEPGSSGIHRAHYEGEWPKGTWWVEDGGDLWPSRPCLFKLYPEDQAKEDARMAAAIANCATTQRHGG